MATPTNFGVSAEEAYGLIATGAQQGADKNGDLLDTLNEYSVHYSSIGLDAKQFLDSLISGADEGAFSIDKIGDAVKEFNIRAKDGSDSSAEMFTNLGLDADAMFTAFSSGGDAAEKAFFDTLKSINGLEDPFLKNQAGVALFGSAFEDLEAGIVPLLGGIEDASYSGTDALQQMNDVKYDDINSMLEKTMRTLEVALLPLAGTLLDSLSDLMPTVTKIMETLAPAIAEVTEVVTPLITDLFDGLLPVIEELLPIIMDLAKNLLAKLIPPIMKIVRALLPALMSVIEALLPILDIVITLLGPILDIIAALITPILDLITSAISPLISVLSQLINTALQPLGPIIQWIGELMTTHLGSAIEIVRPIIDNLIGVFSGLIDFITNVFTGNWQGAWQSVQDIFSNIVGTLGGIFKTPLNFIISGINSFLTSLSTIEIPDWVPGVGGMGFEIPLIPMLAKGGFTDGISIAGEAGVEAVISFDPAFRKENIAYWAQAGQRLGVTDGLNAAVAQPRPQDMSFPAQAGYNLGVTEETNITNLSGTGGTTVVYELGGITFSPRVDVSGSADADKIIDKIKEMEPEFFDMLEDWIRRREAGRYETADNWAY
jgi:phage-related minor tail protein